MKLYDLTSGALFVLASIGLAVAHGQNTSRPAILDCETVPVYGSDGTSILYYNFTDPTCATSATAGDGAEERAAFPWEASAAD